MGASSHTCGTAAPQVDDTQPLFPPSPRPCMPRGGFPFNGFLISSHMRVISRLVCLSINRPIGSIGPSESFSKKFLHAAIYSRILFSAPLGGVAQLGERLTGSQEVRGSIPLVSTQEISRVGSSLSTLFLFRKTLYSGTFRLAADSLASRQSSTLRLCNRGVPWRV